MRKQLSVIIPCFNHGEYIHDALDSIAQSDSDSICEVIIINDGSTDSRTNEILNQININGVRVINKENGGLASARNRGIEESNSDYLLMLDSDNKITPDFITSFKTLIAENVDFDMLHGDAVFFGERYGIFKAGPLNIFKIFQNNYIDACTILRKQCLIELGKYDGSMPYMGWEDWDLWIRMALQNKKTIYVDKIFFHYRYLNNSMIRTIGHKELETKQFLIDKYKNHLIDDTYLEKSISDVVNLNIQKMGIKELLIILLRKIKSRIFKKAEIKHKVKKLWI
jgi:glycosyltransferase involved in cell wall biosynthesis